MLYCCDDDGNSSTDESSQQPTDLSDIKRSSSGTSMERHSDRDHFRLTTSDDDDDSSSIIIVRRIPSGLKRGGCDEHDNAMVGLKGRKKTISKILQSSDESSSSSYYKEIAADTEDEDEKLFLDKVDLNFVAYYSKYPVPQNSNFIRQPHKSFLDRRPEDYDYKTLLFYLVKSRTTVFSLLNKDIVAMLSDYCVVVNQAPFAGMRQLTKKATLLDRYKIRSLLPGNNNTHQIIGINTCKTARWREHVLVLDTYDCIGVMSYNTTVYMETCFYDSRSDNLDTKILFYIDPHGEGIYIKQKFIKPCKFTFGVSRFKCTVNGSNIYILPYVTTWHPNVSIAPRIYLNNEFEMPKSFVDCYGNAFCVEISRNNRVCALCKTDPGLLCKQTYDSDPLDDPLVCECFRCHIVHLPDSGESSKRQKSFVVNKIFYSFRVKNHVKDEFVIDDIEKLTPVYTELKEIYLQMRSVSAHFHGYLGSKSHPDTVYVVTASALDLDIVVMKITIMQGNSLKALCCYVTRDQIARCTDYEIALDSEDSIIIIGKRRDISGYHKLLKNVYVIKHSLNSCTVQVYELITSKFCRLVESQSFTLTPDGCIEAVAGCNFADTYLLYKGAVTPGLHTPFDGGYSV